MTSKGRFPCSDNWLGYGFRTKIRNYGIHYCSDSIWRILNSYHSRDYPTRRSPLTTGPRLGQKNPFLRDRRFCWSGSRTQVKGTRCSRIDSNTGMDAIGWLTVDFQSAGRRWLWINIIFRYLEVLFSNSGSLFTIFKFGVSTNPPVWCYTCTNFICSRSRNNSGKSHS